MNYYVDADGENPLGIALGHDLSPRRTGDYDINFWSGPLAPMHARLLVGWIEVRPNFDPAQRASVFMADRPADLDCEYELARNFYGPTAAQEAMDYVQLELALR